MSDELFKTLADIVNPTVTAQPIMKAAYHLGAAEQTIRDVAWLVSEFENDVGCNPSVQMRDVTALIRDIRRELEMYWMFKSKGEQSVAREHVPLEELERRHESTTSLRAGWMDNNDSVDVKGV
jgi:hypothetical protein